LRAIVATTIIPSLIAAIALVLAPTAILRRRQLPRRRRPPLATG
jgi:hypothetical protein